MYDFFKICCREVSKRNIIESVIVYPKFVIKNRSDDLMVRGGDFYAVWDEEIGLWSTDEDTVSKIIDKEINKTIEELRSKYSEFVKIVPQYMWDSDSGSMDKWHKYVQRQLRDHYTQLDSKVIFQNTEVTKEDYVSKRLPYALKEGDHSAYDELIGKLYSEEERAKIEWSVGSIIAGDSKKIQKFIVLYGSAGTGKSTVLNIIQELFEGYYATFTAKALASSNNEFAMESFKSNPLVAIQHDGDLSRIEDNTKLNSIVSHELMEINEKFTKKYTARIDSFIYMGTNKPVKITEAKSGLLRRLIDVRPTGEKVSYTKYNKLNKQIKYELGAIAYHCLKVYEGMGEDYYNAYIPRDMMSVTNDFYDFMDEYFNSFYIADETTLEDAWKLYKAYCDDANVLYPMPRKSFKEELKSYFEEWQERGTNKDGERVRNLYSGFKVKMFMTPVREKKVDETGHDPEWLNLKEQSSIFDTYCSSCPAQYATKRETPSKKWENVETKLSDLDTSELHYVKLPEHHIVIDFDLKDADGNKSIEKNTKAAEKWPETYAEVSKGGQGIHLHYIYDGDTSKLSNIYSENVEVKTFPGNSSLRRKLTKCNSLPIAHISSGLPIKEEKAKVVNFDIIKNEKQLRSRIVKCLKKEHHGATAPEVDFIAKILDDAYQSGMSYDISDMEQAIYIFANNSTHQSKKCLDKVRKMKFMSEDKEEKPVEKEPEYKSDKIVFFDVEVFKNFFGICWKFEDDKTVNKMFNPTPLEVAELTKYKLVGFNNRRYDNHIIYARILGFSNLQLYNLSQKIIGQRNSSSFFREAYNLSYTDIYDFAATKQSLKKWEIELGIHHQELGLKWDEPAPEEMWDLIMDYCANDVIATEAVFKHLSADFEAREILCAITGSSLNTTTNQNTTKLIVGDDPNPQAKFVYTDLSEMFPGYEYKNGVSTYKGEEVGEGGYVYAEPGIYTDIALLDIASMHPNSAINLNIFGPYTKNFQELVNARIYIKHGDYDSAGKLFGGKLKPYLKDKEQAKRLAYALKIAINSVYGLTAAKFDNKLRDPRNIDNIVAKRGALFMVDLKEEVQKREYTVAHIKTDSIKIPNADQEIIDFVMEFGKRYGYTFEHEATYDRMCLVNDAVYIAKDKSDGHWTATGKQFQVPYVFKTLFSHEPIEFKDMCETKTVTSALYLDMNETLPEGEHDYQFVGKAGSFCPIKPGCGGGLLMRENDDKFSAATGTKGYRWLEAESVEKQNKQEDIDKSYYNKLVDEAIESISAFGDSEWFIHSEESERSN